MVQAHNEWFHQREAELLNGLEEVEQDCQKRSQDIAAQESESKETLKSLEVAIMDTKKQLMAIEDEVSRSSRQMQELQREVSSVGKTVFYHMKDRILCALLIEFWRLSCTPEIPPQGLHKGLNYTCST